MESPQVISIGGSGTGLTLLAWPDRLPDIAWLGQPLDGVVPESRVSILPEHARAWLGRPGLVVHDGGVVEARVQMGTVADGTAAPEGAENQKRQPARAV